MGRALRALVTQALELSGVIMYGRQATHANGPVVYAQRCFLFARNSLANKSVLPEHVGSGGRPGGPPAMDLPQRGLNSLSDDDEVLSCLGPLGPHILVDVLAG